MLLMRSIFGLFFVALYANKELKKAVWDDIDRKSVGPLIFRSCQSALGNIINFSVTKYLPLTFIAIINNLSPLIVVVLAFFILKERIKGFEIAMIVMTVIGVLIVVIFQDPAAAEASGQEEAGPVLNVILYIALFINPFLSAGGSIAMRKMKKFHLAVVSWYNNWAVGLTSLVVILCVSRDFSAIANFDWVSWLLSIATGFFAMSNQTVRFLALKLQKASKL